MLYTWVAVSQPLGTLSSLHVLRFASLGLRRFGDTCTVASCHYSSHITEHCRVFAISELLVLQSLVVAARVYEYSVHGALAKEQEAETWCTCVIDWGITAPRI
jgi:hypothetical protein